MTREEAIRILHSIDNADEMDEEFAEAYDMAIKVLEQEPFEDCVSRHTVKEQMIKYGFRAPDMTVTEFVEDELPSVHPMRKQEPKSEWEQDHEILKAYSDGMNEVLDKIKEDIRRFMFEVNPSSSESDYACNYFLDLIDKIQSRK